jgi:hypothetical protein
MMTIVKTSTIFITALCIFATHRYNDEMTWHETVNYVCGQVLPMVVSV